MRERTETVPTAAASHETIAQFKASLGILLVDRERTGQKRCKGVVGVGRHDGHVIVSGVESVYDAYSLG